MKLTKHTDYAFRVLLYLLEHPDGKVQTTVISDYYDISRNHLVKVVHNLSKFGYVKTTQGRHNSGIELAKPSHEINLGQVMLDLEEGVPIVDCSACTIKANCILQGVLCNAKKAFFDHLDEFTLADLKQK